MELTRHRYRLYGLTVETPFPLPGAPFDSASGERADVVVTWESLGRPEYRWQTVHAPDHRSQPEVGHTDAGEICMAWGDEGDEMLWVISTDRTHVRLFCIEDHLVFAPAMTVGMVLGVLLQSRGVLCLHGSAVRWNACSIAILGPSGAGKSTLTAALVARGAPLLTDDLLAIRQTTGGLSVERGCLGIRLLPASVERDVVPGGVNLGGPVHLGKHVWDLSDQPDDTSETTPLAAIYILQPAAPDDGALVIHALSPRDALPHLVSNWYPPSLQKLMRPAAFAQMGDLARRVPVRIVAYGHRWENLSVLAGQLLS